MALENQSNCHQQNGASSEAIEFAAQQFPDISSPVLSKQLLDTIKLIWQNYRETTAILSTNSIRKHWMQLFLYYCQYVDFDELQKQQQQQHKSVKPEHLETVDDCYDAYNSFFKVIPEQLFAYLLECVCDIINQSEQTEFEESSGFYNTFKHHNFTHLATPYDCSKIVALRSFLTHQLGQHLLLLLARIDIKLIASQKSLAKLCICLFPNCSWDSDESKDLHHNFLQFTLLDYVGDFRLLQPAPNAHKHHYKYAYIICNNRKSMTHKIPIQIETDFGKFCEQKRHSDEIAYLLLNLLHKIIAVSLNNNNKTNRPVGCFPGNSRNNVYEQQAAPNVTEVLLFALQKLNATDFDINSTTTSTPTIDCIGSSERNVVALKWQLLRLLVACLNVQFAQDATTTPTTPSSLSSSTTTAITTCDIDILNHTDFTLVNNTLYAAWTQLGQDDNNNEQKDLLAYAMCYILCGMLHNAIILHTQALNVSHNNNNNKIFKRNNHHHDNIQTALNRNLYTRKLFGIVGTDGWLAMFKLLLMKHKNQTLQQHADDNHNNNNNADKQIDEMISKILRLLLKIGDLFAKYDQRLIINYTFNHEANKNLYAKQHQHHNSTSSGSCTLTSGNNIINKNNNATGINITTVVDKNYSKRISRKKLQHMQQSVQQQQAQQHCKQFPIILTANNNSDGGQQQQQHQQQKLWSCYFQGVLFDVLPIVQDIKLQEFLILGMMEFNGRGICCCHYTLINLEQFLCLAQAPQSTLNLKKVCYKMLQRKLLPAIFMRRVAVTLLEQHVLLHYKRQQQQQQQLQQQQMSSQEQSSEQSQQQQKHQQQQDEGEMECTLCETRAKSLEYHIGILRAYKSHAQCELTLHQDGQLERQLAFLRHLRHIGKFLPYDIATGIVADIALPLFRGEKLKYFQQPQMVGDLRLLQECLLVLASYLQDIRLIKAFYLEENIKHLEDLLVQPLLMRGVLQLIKIGIESSTYLGDIDNLPREQLLLSRRLIMLQVEKSQLAAQKFQQLLREFSAWHCQLQHQKNPTPQSNKYNFFWLNGSSCEDIDDQVNGHAQPLQILQTVTLQWGLNCELLKTSAQFYSEFAKSYSIVLDNFEENDNDEQQVNNNHEEKEEEQKSKHTILDILQLNFNALSSFLLKIPKKRYNLTNKLQQHQQHRKEQQRPKNDIDYFISALIGNHDGNQKMVQKYDSFSAILEHENVEFIVKLFDIKRCREPQEQQHEILLGSSLNRLVAHANAAVVAATAATTTTTAHIMYNSTGKELNAMLQGDGAVLVNENATTPLSDAYNNQSLLSKIFNLVGSFFAAASNGDTENHPEKVVPSMNDDLAVFYESNSEFKKQLLKLFEITLTICVMAYHNEDADKMQSHLRKLKSIILENAVNNWQSHSEENVRDNVVLKTLQTLLKIAEMMGELQRNETTPSEVATTTPTTTLQGTAATATILAAEASSVTTKSKIRKKNSLDLITSENRTALSLSSSLYGVTAAIVDDSEGEMSDNFYRNNYDFNYGHNGDDDDDDNHDATAADDFGDTNYDADVNRLKIAQNDKSECVNAATATADDGYEADGEVADSSAGGESDVATHTCLESAYDARNMATAALQNHNNGNNSDIWQALQPASRYRTHVLHSGLCRLVVEILMELSHLCVKQAVVGVGGWCESLAQLANRLFVVRECLGGPLFLLRGFTPVLTCNDVRLKELQQCILELITDLNTPELLCAYFAIMATPNPPMDILVNYMGYICMGSLMRRPCPTVELEFPLIIDGRCTSTADITVSQRIERIRNYHIQCQMTTPLTRSPCIIPITHTRLWNDKGITISMWMQAKSSFGMQKNNSHDDDGRSSGDDMTRMHLVSIGTEQTMLSIYLNSNLTLAFETNRPYADMKHQNTTPTTTDGKETVTVININNNKNNNNAMQATTTNSLNLSDVNHMKSNFNLNNNNNNNLCDNNKPKSQFRNALKQTKRVFLNHFSNMHFFNTDSTEESSFENTLYELKALRLVRQKWTHLVFAIKPETNSLNIHVFVNALEHHEFALPFPNFLHLSTNHNFQILALGEGQVPRHVDSRSTLDAAITVSSLRYSLSNVMLFRSQIVDSHALINLTAMGPDFTEMPQCQVGNLKANYGFLQLSRMQNANFGNHTETMKLWWEQRILVYTAQMFSQVTAYDWTTDIENEFAQYGHAYGLMLYSELMPNQLPSLQTAAVLCGGLSTLIFMFARVVEATTDANTQANALDMLLKAALSDSQLYTEFVRQDYMSLLGHVIRTEACSKDVRLLRSIVNNICTQPLISRDIVNDNTNACIIHPRLLVAVLQRYGDWYRSGTENSHVLDCTLKCVLALTREKHPQRDFNMEQLQRAGLMQALLNLVKVFVIESPNPVFISETAAQRFVAIIRVFAGSPPSPSLMDEIMKLLLLLHKPSECYITHDRSKFYFLLRSRTTNKGTNASVSSSENSYNLGRRVTATFRRTNRTAATSKAHEEYLAREARVERLRNLRNSQQSNYRRPLKEFIENLEQTADCTRLNQQAPRLLSPKLVGRWRQKFKQQQHHGRIALKNVPEYNHETAVHATIVSTAIGDSPLKRKSIVLASPLAIAHKRLRLQPMTNHGTRVKRETRRINCERNNSHGSLSTMPTTTSTTLPFVIKTDFYSAAGIVALQEGLFGLLKDFLYLLPDNIVEDVLKHYIKIEYLLVLANHRSCAVRAAIVQLLSAITKRLSFHDLNNYLKNYFAQHLGNQLCMHPTDINLFESCLQWVTGVYGNMDVILNTETLCVQQRFGLNALLAIITNARNSQCDFLERAFHVLLHLFNNAEHEEQQAQLFEAGLLQCSIKTLFNIFTQSNSPEQERSEKSIKLLLMAIGEYSLKSVGHITIIWDILNILSWYQEQDDIGLLQKMRAVQSELQLHWIKLFFNGTTSVDNNAAARFKVQVLKKSTLSMSETRTRLDLLIDRSAQFFTVCNASYEPTSSELDLFKYLVNYGICCNQRCNNLLAWGLKPSRPRQLRAFIVQSLWLASQEQTLPSIICDGKMLKSLLWLCQLEDLEQPIEDLEPLCKRLGINDNDSAWNLANELERIEVQRVSVLGKQKAGQERTLHKFNTLASSCIESSMIITRRVADVQNSERKLLMNHMKDYDESCIYGKWLEIIRRMTHEGAPWYCKDRSENSWELDNTEGPSRVHTRLRRCHLDIDKRFFMENYCNDNDKTTTPNNCLPSRGPKGKASTIAVINKTYSRPLDYLIGCYDQQLNISLNSQILYNFPAKYLPVDGEIDGEIIITGHKLYFLATYHCKYFYVSCEMSNIAEIWMKRYQHQEKAFEIFLDTNQSLFFSLQNIDDWKIVREVFSDKIVIPPDANKILLITQQWREGLLTNWEYLMSLNQISGRTYNDLMQYPVFPWILANYANDKLDLLDSTNYRKLEKPIAVQHPDNEHHYVNNYTYINSTMTNMGSLTLKPYHYSSHYSNSGTVLHFMVRVPPYTSYFLRYQDNNFDLPDRTFHALNTTWNLASRDSPTDVKELIPEFFCLPEMFENFERFNFGCRQNGERVEDVLMPAWCLGQSRLFVLIHRQALESEYVRNNLHNWIDLTFGFKQTGDAAIEAINVFHPATYSVFVESEVLDPIERKAVETMVRTYGQMPRQLFKSQHPSTKALNYQPCFKEVLSSVRGLRWGLYVGSPQLPVPTLGNMHKLPGADQLLSFNNTNAIYGLSQKSCVMQGSDVDTYNVISWGFEDRIVRIQPLSKMFSKTKKLMHNSAFDDITACGACPHSNQLWFGHRSGRISVYKCQANETAQRQSKNRPNYVRGLRLSYNSAFRKIISKNSIANMDADGEVAAGSNSNDHTNTNGDHREGADLHWLGPTVLIRHMDEITCISLSVEFKIVVSAGRDGIAVIWDLNNLSYVRTIERPAEIHLSPITLLTISPTLGDIVTVHTIPWHSKENKENVGIDDDLITNASIATESSDAMTATATADECFEVTEENTDDFVNVYINPNGKSMMRLHTVNARYVEHLVHEERISAVCYSYVKEGVGINVIATAIEGGIVRLWSSWNLSFVTEIVTGLTNIKDLVYSTHQHLIVLTKESHIQVWETEGLTGSSPKFPQIVYK